MGFVEGAEATAPERPTPVDAITVAIFTGLNTGPILQRKTTIEHRNHEKGIYWT